MNPVRLAHSASSLRQLAPPSRSAKLVRQAKGAKLRPPNTRGRRSRRRVSRPSDRKPSMDPVRLAHSANPLRQPTPPTHSANPLRQPTPPSRAANQVRQAETANRQRSAKPPPSLPALGSEAVDESRSTRPHRHRTTPTHSAKLVRQAKGAKLRPPAAGEAAAGFQHSDRKPSMNPVRPAHTANPHRQPTPPSRSAKSLRQSGAPN